MMISRTFRRLIFLLCFMMLATPLLVLLTSLQPHVLAASRLARVTGNSAANATTGHVTVIVLDMSGSMGQNDPQGIRCSAANAYIDLSGINDYIGVVGLDNNNGLRTGNHNFMAAMDWTQPLSTDTLNDRQQLRAIIKNKSNGCRPDNTTPTYDALAKAYAMLDSATSKKQLTGSVILLTDGGPYPDTQAQVENIQSELAPKFKSRGWPIDTVALGANGPVLPGTSSKMTFHDFLNDVASGTSGTFYADTDGPVKGDLNGSPLNIAPFFVDIFSKRIGRTPGKDIEPTTLNGGTTTRNFTVADYANNLDVVVVKDQPGTTASLVTPSGQTITPSSGATVVAQDNYYVIFAIDQPLPGTWELDVSGSGQFLMKSLHLSSVGISIDRVAMQDSSLPATQSLPLGQPLVVSASLTSNGQLITDNNFAVSGTIRYTGGAGQFSEPFALNDKAVAGNYVGAVTVPPTAPAGSYDIQVAASTVSLANLVSSKSKSVRLELFPTPLFLSPKTGQPTDSSVNATVLLWSPPLSWLYNLPILNAISGWPLQSYSAEPVVTLAGVVQWQGKPYTDPQTRLQAQAQLRGTQTTIPVTIIQDSPGTFHAQFVATNSGVYTIVFLTSGNYQQSHGDFGPTRTQVQVTVVPASAAQNFRAYGITLFYIGFFAFLCFLVKFLLTPAPFGEWSRTMGGEFADSYKFSRAHPGPLQWFFQRNQLTSRQAAMPRGLLFKFGFGGNIMVKPDGAGSRDWHLADGSPLQSDFQRARELIFRPAGIEDWQDEEQARYTIVANSTKGRSSYAPDDTYGVYDIYQPTSGRKGKRQQWDYGNDSNYNEMQLPKSIRRKNKQSKSKQNYKEPYEY